MKEQQRHTLLFPPGTRADRVEVLRAFATGQVAGTKLYSFVTVRCGRKPARLVHGEWTWYRCSDGTVPVGHRNVQAGLAAGDEYTHAVCSSRRYLYEHMDDAVRQAFAESFRVCELH